MGDSGSRRSTLVSRLPIFRRSISRKHDSLPSSPSSSNTVGVHSSSPSSTNSSSGSTGKRRSIFRTPSISFHHKKGSEPKQEPTNQNLSISNGAQPGHSSMQKLSLEEHIKTRGRHSVGFSSSRNKKLTRSLTEDFEREKEHSANKNVFINCLSSGKSEGDDSGFTEEQTRRSVKQSTKKLLTKSFSSHYKFSKPVPQSQSISLVQQSEFSLEIAQYQEREPVLVRASPSCSVDVTERAGSSLQSPLLSADLTTAQTPSEFLALTEDSVSEADGFPKSGSLASHCDNFGHNDSTSQISPNPAAVTKTTIDLVGTVPCAIMSPGKYRLEGRCSTESNSLPETSAANQKEVLLQITELPVMNGSDSETHLSAGIKREECMLIQNGEAMLATSSPRKLGYCEQHKAIAERVKGVHPISDSRIIPSSGDHHIFNKTSYGYDANPAKVLASSFSPYREGRFIERRLRSSSEGTAGNSRMILKPKDGNAEEVNSLRKQRASSSSSKMNSMDVLNNLGSCELDEDDLMLDLEFLEEQNLRPSVCREDSYHSVVSCAAVVLTPMEPTIEMKKREELKFPEPSKQNLSLKLTKDNDQEARFSHVSRMPSSPSADWPLQGVEENGGLDSLPFRLMLQDCTAVKTLLLKMKRVLQESADMSPASSTASLPVSPLTEEPSPFKDIMKDECSLLKLQLKEKDELISQLQEELERVRHLQKAFTSKVDKSTQTELLGYDGLNQKRLEAVQGGREATYRNRIVSQSLSTRDRKAVHTPTEDRFRYSAADQTSPYKSKTYQLSSLCLSNFLKDKELVEVIKHSRGTYETLTSEVTQNLRATVGQSSLKTTAKTEGLSTFSEKPKDPATVARQHSTFTGRFGQPPRGPISLHMYSRKNVFLHHNLHTTELQTLGQQDG
ncbi:serine-rich coiled-coil domain-containing protein 1 isoform X1 [Camelus ferus]|uniref:Serine-rich coiled-coil domain-containing protein 1 isoform X1 n=8 Tax=Camelus TaxID=9836 RepID=A0A8B8RC90_CAMFR|nr:serine-rich coiled-coil domain-containing protein 1 isoform X1 [Camelus ferus]XP_032315591.1 serine-rich coiled-coil domain-containing protein 1 isoform X1 [Camelus ferus]XP_032315597.1 serine-rich coiled-coil domain-containing protein 1 isoform X1 [Camelus ferus]XP_032315604.1 serine-rich coiled-coil domain-containing protein 1 isoform X1 [Camelus ferus]XP_032315613.1 serine-rich coiled-coil domain-containing protein 1 isoform X1 [Camelus ferus]XP_032315622.1 serine-rich coiled-coil domain